MSEHPVLDGKSASVRARLRGVHTAAVVLCTMVLLVVGCAAARGPGGQLADAANELNLATRFGRMDVATSHTSSTSRDRFLERRQRWGNEIRVVDINVAGIQLRDSEHADVLVQIAWTRMSEATLHSTAINQSWSNTQRGGWRLEHEKHVAGDVGLFGENVPAPARPPPRDVHFPSRSLGSIE